MAKPKKRYTVKPHNTNEKVVIDADFFDMDEKGNITFWRFARDDDSQEYEVALVRSFEYVLIEENG